MKWNELAAALLRARPGASWTIHHKPADDGEYVEGIPGLVWLDDSASPPTSVELEQAAALLFKDAVTVAVQKRLDAFAKTRSYDGILSAATYATSTVPKFAAEGQYAVNARDAHWAKCYEILGAVESGERPMPASADEVLAEMPPLGWPQ